MMEDSVLCTYDKREKALDWLTGLFPIVLISLFYYRWQAAALEVLAIGGYFMAAVLLELLPFARCRQRCWAHGVFIGLLAAFCLPAGAPFWLAALLGGTAAVIDTAPVLIGYLFKREDTAVAPLHPAITAYLIIWLIFPAAGCDYSLPAQWRSVDTLASATPLAAFHGQSTAVTDWQLFFGIRAGAIGETCVAAILLGAVYLLIRRRLRLIAPASMLATVSLLSLLLWRSPLYSLLAGSTVLTALLLADRDYAPKAWYSQLIIGVAAGALTVLLRRYASFGEATAIALLAAELLTPFLPYLFRFARFLIGILHPVGHAMRRLWEKIAKSEKNS